MSRVSRREAVAGAGLAVAFGLTSRLTLDPAFAQTTAAPAKGFSTYKVGSFECTAVYDGIWEKPHDPTFITNASVDDVKGAMRKAGLADAFVSIPFTPLLVKAGSELIQFDAGTGGQVQPSAGTLHANMKAAGLDPAKVTKVMISHFHPDHIFGLMAKGTNAQVYPNAEIIVSAAEYAFWTDPAVIEKLPEGRRPLAKRIQSTIATWKNVRRIDGEREVMPGVRTIATPGHTPGHIAFHLSSGNAQLIYSGDTFYQPAMSLPNPGWHGVFDQNAALAEKSRRTLADRLVADKIPVAGYHFPWPGAGIIAKDGAGYTLTPSKA